VVVPTAIDLVVGRYSEYLRRERALSPSTAAFYLRIARTFLPPDGDLRSLTAASVTAFVLKESRKYCVSYTKYKVSALRSLLRHLFVQGDIATDLGAALIRQSVRGSENVSLHARTCSTRGFELRAGPWEAPGAPPGGPFSARDDFGSEGSWRSDDASRQAWWREPRAGTGPATQKPGSKTLDVAKKTAYDATATGVAALSTKLTPAYEADETRAP
jgi:hypothetical protein